MDTVFIITHIEFSNILLTGENFHSEQALVEISACI